jgi:hypothetical protein
LEECWVEMALRNNFGHVYGQEDQNRALQQPQSFILGTNKGFFNFPISSLQQYYEFWVVSLHKNGVNRTKKADLS